MSLLQLVDVDASIRRVWRTAVLLTALLAVALAFWTRSPGQVFGAVVGSALMMASFRSLVALSDRLLGRSGASLTSLQAAFLGGRTVLLALCLCATVLLPGVGPIPVVLGVSVLVAAILLEAVFQMFFAGAASRH